MPNLGKHMGNHVFMYILEWRIRRRAAEAMLHQERVHFILRICLNKDGIKSTSGTSYKRIFVYFKLNTI